MNIKTAIKKSQRLRNENQDLLGARRVLEDAFRRAKTPSKKLLVYPFLAGIHLDLGNVKTSDRLFREGIVLARKQKDDMILADLLRKYGYIMNKFHKNSYEKALRSVNESISILENQTFRRGVFFLNDAQKILASAYAAKGNILGDNGKWKEALRWYRRGLRLAEQYFPERTVTIRGDIANVYIWHMKKYSAAWRILERMLIDAARFYRHALPAAFQRFGYLYFHKKRYDAAEAYFKLAELAARGIPGKGVWKRELADALKWQKKSSKSKEEKSRKQN